MQNKDTHYRPLIQLFELLYKWDMEQKRLDILKEIKADGLDRKEEMNIGIGDMYEQL